MLDAFAGTTPVEEKEPAPADESANVGNIMETG
jgi:hypothetical protein